MIPVVPIVWILWYLARKGGSPRLEPAATTSAADALELLKSLFYVGVWCVVLSVFGPPGPGTALAAAYLGTAFPHHLAWRVCHPLRLVRTGHALLWLAPHWRARRRRGALIVHDTSLGRPLSAALPAKQAAAPLLDAWTVCGAVLAAEHAGSPREAAALVDGLMGTFPGRCLGHGVRGRGVDLMASAAAERGDWPEVARRASLGRGGGPRFLRLVARAHLVGDVSRTMLRLAWVLSPGRFRRRHLLAAALGAAPLHTPRSAADDTRPWSAHLEALDRAARGEPIELRRLAEIARGWDAVLGGEEEARFRARALALGSTRSAETLDRLRESLVADLVSASASASGAWPAAEGDGRLASALRERLVDQVYEVLSRHSHNGNSKAKADIGAPLDEWREWLQLRGALDRLGDRFGEEALRGAWYGGAQLVAWNWPCRLLDVHGDRGAWACHMMFQWTAETARRCHDKEAARVNEKNTAVALQRVAAA
jgi:hypothetical protein